MNLPAGLSNFQWRYFAASDIPDILDSISGFIDGKLCLGNDRSVAGVPFDFPENGIINMYDIITPAPECDSRTVLTADFSLKMMVKCWSVSARIGVGLCVLTGG